MGGATRCPGSPAAPTTPTTGAAAPTATRTSAGPRGSGRPGSAPSWGSGPPRRSARPRCPPGAGACPASRSRGCVRRTSVTSPGPGSGRPTISNRPSSIFLPSRKGFRFGRHRPTSIRDTAASPGGRSCCSGPALAGRPRPGRRRRLRRRPDPVQRRPALSAVRGPVTGPAGEAGCGSGGAVDGGARVPSRSATLPLRGAEPGTGSVVEVVEVVGAVVGLEARLITPDLTPTPGTEPARPGWPRPRPCSRGSSAGPPPSTATPSRRPSSTTPCRPTATRPRRAPPWSGPTTCTTCAPGAGTTSAPTSSSTATAACSRAATAASPGPCSAPTRAGQHRHHRRRAAGDVHDGPPDLLHARRPGAAAAWKLDLTHVDPRGLTVLTSAGGRSTRPPSAAG